MAGTDVFPLSPDFTLAELFDEGVLRSRSMGRKEHMRTVAPPQRLFHLVFNGRSVADRETLLQWYREFEATWFRFDCAAYLYEGSAYLTRSFPATFDGPPRFDFIGNDQYNMSADLREAVGCLLPNANCPDPSAGHPTATITGVVSGSDKIFVYGGYGFVYTGAGTLTLDGAAASSPCLYVALGLHRVYVTGGSGTLEAII